MIAGFGELGQLIIRWPEELDVSVLKMASGRVLVFGMEGLEASAFQRLGEDGKGFAVVSGHFAPRIVPFQEVIVVLCTDTEARYVGFSPDGNIVIT